jgi:hypothetical protein
MQTGLHQARNDFFFFLQQNNSHELLISGGFSADSAVIANDAANP